MADTAWIELAFEQAVRYLRGKKPTPRDVFDEMTVAARDQAFTVSRIAKLETMQEVLDALDDAMTQGMTLSEFIDANESLGLTDAHLETIYRTNIQSAFGRGRFDQLSDPLISSAVWGWRYKTVGDDRVRPEHAALDGLEFQTGTHDEIFPPWSFNCRCSTEVVTRREARENDLQSASLPSEVQEALTETDFTSPALGSPYRPDLGGYDLGLVSHFVNDQASQGGGATP